MWTIEQTHVRNKLERGHATDNDDDVILDCVSRKRDLGLHQDIDMDVGSGRV